MAVAQKMIPLVAPCYGSLAPAEWEEGHHVRLFEEEFAEYVGCDDAVAVNSGTSALTVALSVLGYESFKIPTFSCRALLDAAHAAACSFGLYDSGFDVERAASRILGRFSAPAVIVHAFGTPTSWTGEESPFFLEDLTLSLGAVRPRWAGVCSFNRDKMISTGRGGMIFGRDRTFIDDCRELANYDQNTSGYRYRPAFSMGMTGMQAALGRSQLAQLPEFIQIRRNTAAIYTRAFREAGIMTPRPDCGSVFFRYLIAVNDPADKVRQLERRGVQAGRGVNPPLHRILWEDYNPSAFPGAEAALSSLLSIPVHPSLTEDDIAHVIRSVIDVCGLS